MFQIVAAGFFVVTKTSDLQAEKTQCFHEYFRKETCPEKHDRPVLFL
jgi:hypothetical protein